MTKMLIMKKFILLYHGYEAPTPDREAAWNTWHRRRAESIADLGHPFGPGRRITNNATDEFSLASNPASGFSIVVAKHIDAAEQLLEGCPIVESITLYEALEHEAGAPHEHDHRPATTNYSGLHQNGREVSMRNIKVERTVAAPRANVWSVLADYPNIAAWNDGVQNSYAIGEALEGIGAQRQCELTPSGAMRETVEEWVPEEKMVIAIDQIEKIPVKSATMTFTLADQGENTPFTMSYSYDPKGGPLAFVVAAMLGRPMNKGFNGFIDSLERAAQAQTTG